VKVIPIKPATSWSYSRYSDYRQCPLKFRLKHLDKIKEPGSEAMQRGTEIHDKAEAYIKGTTDVLDPRLGSFETELKAFREQYKKKINGMVVEDTWAFTSNWDETSWDDWVHCWVRIKLDCAHHLEFNTMVVSDWKTGKIRQEMVEDYMEQLELYALAALLLHEHIEAVIPRLCFTDQGEIYPRDPIVYVRSEMEDLKKKWTKRVKPMMTDTVFAPRPNDKCRWCFYRASNKTNGGGQCKY